MRMRPQPFLDAAAAILVCACGGTGTTPTAAPATEAITQPPATAAPVDLTILGAASLKAVLAKVETAYEAANLGTTLTVSTDSSSALESKIEQGATADVFLSADTTNPQKLVDGGFASGSIVIFAGNKLTIIVPKDNPAGITSPKDLVKPGVDIIAAGDAVPITKYATKLIT